MEEKMKQISKLIAAMLLTVLIQATQLFAQAGSIPIRVVRFNDDIPAGSNFMVDIYDNFGEARDGMISDWGYSMFVSYNGTKILFDGGASAPILKNNAEAAGIDLTDIDFAVLSHSHGDHTPGIHYLVEVNPDVTIYVPKDEKFGYGDTGDNKKYRKGYMYKSDHVVFVTESREIADGITLIATESANTGTFSKYPPHGKEPRLVPLPELSLALAIKDGSQVLISGCSHTGIELITAETKKALKSDILFVTGGFHLGPYNESYIEDLAGQMKNELGVTYCAATHCTGRKGIGIFETAYGDRFVKGGLGTKIVFPK